MKGKENKKEAKKEKMPNKSKALSEYQKEKQSKSDVGMSIVSKKS